MDQRLLLMHQAMLADRTRLHAYDQALEQTVGAGDVVVDVGAGTLVLSMLALRHGAEHVYAIEGDPRMAEVAAGIIEQNDLKGRITLVQADARKVRLPGKADVVVSEMMGNLGPEEQMMDVIGAVARRNLRPGGKVVPNRLVTSLAAIEFDGEGWGLWDEDFLGYRLDGVRDSVEQAAHLHVFQRPPALLGDPVTIADERPENTGPGLRIGHRIAITRPGRLHAVAGYFTATLAPGVTLSNFPSYPGCNWAVWIWPLRHTAVAAGDSLSVKVRCPTGVRVVTDWELECGISRAGRA